MEFKYQLQIIAADILLPYRTMQEWELGRRVMPEYVLRLFATAISWLYCRAASLLFVPMIILLILSVIATQWLAVGIIGAAVAICFRFKRQLMASNEVMGLALF